MHFGKRLEKDLVERWKPHYLQYKLLKKQIKEIEEKGDNTDVGTASSSVTTDISNQQISYHEFSFRPKAYRYHQLSLFKPLLEKEVEKINDFTTSKVKELQNRILQLLRTSTPWKGHHAGQETVPGNLLTEWEAFMKEETKEADRIAEELVDIDKFIRQNCIACQKIIKKFDKRLKFDVAPWLNAQLMENEPFLKVNLDALLLAISDVYEMLAGYKYELKGFQKSDETAEEQRKKGISAQSFERKTTKYWVRAENLMKLKVAILKNLPVYLFDRKSGSVDTVKTKNFLRDFHELYGTLSDSSAISSIYMDNDNLDIYHTRLKRVEGAQLYRLRWYGDAQSLPSKDYIFLERKTHHESWVEAKSVKERFPIKTKNVQGFLEGKFNPAENMQKWMKPEKGVKLIKNESELEKAVELASECKEAFAQLKLKPMVRTLYSRTAFQARDNNEVRISIDKNLTLVNENIIPEADNEFPWCRDMLRHQFPPHDILQFPYCILEVKLNCDSPSSWITDILADTSSIIERAKFSKFMTGMAFHHYDKVSELPYWFEGQVAIDPRNRFLPEQEKEKLIYQDINQQFDHSEEFLHEKSNVQQSPTHHTINVEEVDETTPLLAREVKPKVTFVESQPTRSGIFSGGMFSSLRRRFTGSSSGGSRPLKPIRSSNRIKIEPKTSFANERTLIQWVSAASLMITLATLIMTSGSEMGFKAGFVFFPLAFLIMFYAIVRFQYRAWSFRHRRNAFHDDLYGPVFLVISIAAAMGVIMYLMFNTNGIVAPVSPNTGSGCEKFNTTGLSDYFPHSDIDYSTTGKYLYSVAPFSVARYYENSWQVNNLPNFQILSIAHSNYDDVVYLGIEKPFVFGVYNFISKNLQQINLADLKSSYNLSFKALAVIKNQVLIPGSDGTIYKFNMKYKQNSTLLYSLDLIEVIPSTVTTTHLIDEYQYKQMSGFYYDETSNLLYVLFGRSRVLRVFNYPAMSMIQEWSLPGNTFQWSGIALKTVNGSENIFLSQSIPSSVWQFKPTDKAIKLEAGLNEAFPACANVYKGDFLDLIERPTNDKFKRNVPKYVNDY